MPASYSGPRVELRSQDLDRIAKMLAGMAAEFYTVAFNTTVQQHTEEFGAAGEIGPPGVRLACRVGGLRGLAADAGGEVVGDMVWEAD